jgi:predicted amidophosphoribosyltransferase
LAIEFVELVFPDHCRGCGRTAGPQRGRLGCPDCEVGLPALPRWAAPPEGLRGLWVGGDHDGLLGALIKRGKYSGDIIAIERVGRHLGALAAGRLPPVDAVTWAPSPLWRQLRRGVEPTALMAAAVGKALDRPVELLLKRAHGASLAGQSAGERRRRLRGATRSVGTPPRRVLLIDDVQFLAGKERSQEEFFHTFNTLLDGRNQVVLTCDRPACEIKSLEPRLISRFECGLTVEMQPPQMETRLAILRKKSLDWKVRVDESVLMFLAEKIRTNVRRLEGALMRVATYASLAGESVTVDKVEHLLRDLIREEASRQVTIDAIQKAVAEHFDVRLADMTSRRRPASIAFPRQVAMFLSRSLTKGSLMEIGEAFGGRDHGTVIHACKKVGEKIDEEAGLKETIARIEAQLRR